jgi:Transposase DNA-binding
MGHSIPLVCQDWANTKAAYRFFSNNRVVLGGRGAAPCGSRRHYFSRRTSRLRRDLPLDIEARIQGTSAFGFRYGQRVIELRYYRLSSNAPLQAAVANAAGPKVHIIVEMKLSNHEHVYRCNSVPMIAKDGLPALRRWPPSLSSCTLRPLSARHQCQA